MARVEQAPERRCPECGGTLRYTSSIAGGGPYAPGDTFKTAATQHHYDCPECERRFMAQDAAGLVKVGTPPEARREPERRRLQSVSLILS